MIKKILLIALSFASFVAVADVGADLEGRYQPDTYTKYDLQLKEEKMNISVFKIVREEPHLNPVYFDIYFQCANTKSYYKLKREFGEYESELSYCGNENPKVEKIDEKAYLSLPLKLATPELGCSDKVNRKEIFSVKEIQSHCEQQSKM